MNYKSYWGTWIVLLILTVIMVVIDSAMAGTVLIVVLLAAMTIKAILIAGTFMHLKSEHKGLILTVILGLAAVAIALFAGIATDANRANVQAWRW